MSDLVARPTFYEGEVLPAGDLVATVNYSRDQMARHERYLHSWGIAFGLELNGNPAADAAGVHKYKTVTLNAGVAIDGRGREIVVPGKVTLIPNDFINHVKPLPDPNAWYPVFLSGRDEDAAPASLLTGACDSSMPTRTKENYDVTYGMPGTELNLDQQQAAAVADGPGDGVTSDPWKVLLGFVQWSPDIPQFFDVRAVNDMGVRRRYADVYAEGVVSRSGYLRLATHPTDFKGQTAVMAVEIHEEKNGELVFGIQNADGTMSPVVTITSKGDVIATGQVSGAVTPGSMHVQSGIAFDGMTVPLPVGIDPADVAAGKVTAHIHVSVHYENLQAPSLMTAGVPFPLECRVDGATRQVHCRLQWWDTANWTQPPIVLPAPCDYTAVVAVPASKGSGS